MSNPFSWPVFGFDYATDVKEKQIEEQKSVTFTDPVSISNIFSDLSRGKWRRVDSIAAMSFFEKNGVLHDAVMKIAKRFASIKPIIKTKSGDIIDQHRVLKFLNHPNESQTYLDFARDLAVYYLVSGSSCIFINGSNNRSFAVDYKVRPFDLYVCPTPYISQFSDKVVNFRVDSSSLKDSFMNGVFTENSGRFFRKSGGELVYKTNFVNPSITDNLLASSCLSPIFYEIEQLNSGNEHNISLLLNGVSLSGVFSVNNSSPDYLDQLKKDLGSYFSGTSGAGKYLVSSGSSITFAPVTATNKDMQYGELKEAARKVIYNYYEIPLALVDNSASTMNNLQTSQIAIYDNAVLPLADVLFSFLTEIFLNRKALNDGEYLSYEESMITSLKERRWEEIKQKSKTNALTPNELRAELGYDPVDGGDSIYRNGADVPIGSDTNIYDNWHNANSPNPSDSSD